MTNKLQLNLADVYSKKTDTHSKKDRHTDRHPFNGLFSRTIWVNRHQKA